MARRKKVETVVDEVPNIPEVVVDEVKAITIEKGYKNTCLGAFVVRSERWEPGEIKKDSAIPEELKTDLQFQHALKLGLLIEV